MSIEIIFGGDHRGYEMKRIIQSALAAQFATISMHDMGPDSEESVDYPIYSHQVGAAVSNADHKRFGVLICGSGIGVCIAANKVPGVRAATCRSTDDAVMTRKHNDANVLCIGADVTSITLALKMVQAFVNTEFEGGRHQNRVNLIEG